MFAALLATLPAPAWADAPPAVAPAPCAAPVALPALEAALAGAEAAWGVDEAAFVRGVAAARAALACVAAPLSPGTAAHVHRVEGLAAFLDRDPARASRAFAAAKALDPAYTFPPAMVQPQNPVRIAYDSAPAATDTRPLPPPARSVGLWVDGAEGRSLPTDRAAIVQVQRRDGSLQASTWLLPTDPLPDYRLRGEGLRLPLVIGAGVLAVGTAVSWSLGADARAHAIERSPASAEVSAAEWEERQAAANALGATTVIVGAAAAGTGVSAFLFARW